MANVFFSYSHKDEALRDELEVHLAMLKREGVISAWHDRKILAGDELNGQIHARLSDAQVILLLVSPDFLASAYCHDVEVKRAMELHAEGKARVIPVILRPSDWQPPLRLPSCLSCQRTASRSPSGRIETRPGLMSCSSCAQHCLNMLRPKPFRIPWSCWRRRALKVRDPAT